MESEIACDAKFCAILDLTSIFLIALKRHLNSQYNFFCRIFVTVFFVAIFNFIGNRNNATCDITLHNEFR